MVVVVAVLFVVAVLAGLAFWVLRRRGSDEMHSVAGYQHRLERLEEVRRRQLGSVRVIGGTSPEEDQASQPVIGESGHLEISSSSSRRRMPEDSDRPRVRERRGSPTHGPRRDMAIARMGHRPRRLGAPIAAAVAVIVLVTGLAIAGAHSRTPSSTTQTTTGHHQGGTAGSKSTTTTTTTTPKPTTFTASSTSGSNADYPLPFASYTVVVTATSADCYVQVTNASGQVPYAAVLHAGQHQQLTLTGDATIVLGAPAYAQVEVDRTPVTFPSPVPAPLNLVFQATAPSSTTSTTS